MRDTFNDRCCHILVNLIGTRIGRPKLISRTSETLPSSNLTRRIAVPATNHTSWLLLSLCTVCSYRHASRTDGPLHPHSTTDWWNPQDSSRKPEFSSPSTTPVTICDNSQYYRQWQDVVSFRAGKFLQPHRIPFSRHTPPHSPYPPFTHLNVFHTVLSTKRKARRLWGEPSRGVGGMGCAGAGGRRSISSASFSVSRAGSWDARASGTRRRGRVPCSPCCRRDCRPPN